MAHIVKSARLLGIVRVLIFFSEDEAVKTVGVVPLWDADKNSMWMLPGYFKGIMAAGAVPLMLPLCDDGEFLKTALLRCDALLFTGGQDVAPALYGEHKRDCCGEICTLLDTMEQVLIKEVLARDMPILGICRGLQILNVVLGGTLYQDLHADGATEIEHHMQPPYDRGVHEVSIIAGGLLSAVTGKSSLRVNSYHHQAIKKLSASMSAEGISEDGLTEAARVNDANFALGVQWLPEFLIPQDETSLRLFKALTTA